MLSECKSSDEFGNEIVHWYNQKPRIKVPAQVLIEFGSGDINLPLTKAQYYSWKVLNERAVPYSRCIMICGIMIA